MTPGEAIGYAIAGTLIAMNLVMIGFAVVAIRDYWRNS